MNDFEYHRAARLDDAMAHAAAERSHYIAGGTELLNWIRLGIVEPERVIDLGFSDVDRGIARERDELVIGALATLNEVGEHALVAEHATALAEACLAAASAQVRNRATLGGNVLQKTRCAYFRSEAPLPWPCNKRAPGSGCAARDGLNERHAIFGWTDACVAVQPSDPLVALACLDAQVDVVGPHGARSLPVRSLHLTQQEAQAEREGAGLDVHEAELETRLAPQEIIVRFRIRLEPPSPNGGSGGSGGAGGLGSRSALGGSGERSSAAGPERSAYVKVRERASYEYALVSAAAAVRIENGAIASARIALGSVAQRPWRLEAAERALVGAAPAKTAVLPAIEAALADARPLAHNAYKVRLAANAAARAVVLAGGAA